ncbi:hypothetical protein COV25_02625, partial [candidate division WWE3 bacterium CG10_big_fil_rev_8_21_14_0_10_35_32]
MKHFIIYAILSVFIIFLSVSFYFAIEEYVVDREFGKCYVSIQSLKKDLLEVESDAVSPKEMVLLSTDKVSLNMDVTRIEIDNIPTPTYMPGLYKDGEETVSITYFGQETNGYKVSPSGKHVGFYYDNGAKTGYHGDIALGIMDVETRKVNTIYEGGFKTSNWEWAGDEHVVVQYGCGTYCMYAYKINIKNGKVE